MVRPTLPHCAMGLLLALSAACRSERVAPSVEPEDLVSDDLLPKEGVEAEPGEQAHVLAERHAVEHSTEPAAAPAPSPSPPPTPTAPAQATRRGDA